MPDFEGPPRFEISLVPSDLGGYVLYEDYDHLLQQYYTLAQSLAERDQTEGLSELSHYQDQLHTAMQEMVALETHNKGLILALRQIVKTPEEAEAIAGSILLDILSPG